MIFPGVKVGGIFELLSSTVAMEDMIGVCRWTVVISEELVESEEEMEMDWDLRRELERDLGRELERDLDLERETGPGCGPMFSMLMTMSSGISERSEIGDIGDNE